MIKFPVIDLQKKDCEQKFLSSLRETGFAVLKNHPLDLDLVESIYKHWKLFFRSDQTQLYTYDKNNQDGFFSLSDAESAKGQLERDLKEYFHFYTWGRCPEDLREELLLYFDSALNFAVTLLSWIDNYLKDQMIGHKKQRLAEMVLGSHLNLLRILYYPPLKGHESALRAAPHEDINLITILPMSNATGLELLAQNKTWVPIRADFDNLVVNTGDMLQEVSGGVFPSASHRVLNPIGPSKNFSRMSLPLFVHPRPDVVLSERHTAASYLSERLSELGVV